MRLPGQQIQIDSLLPTDKFLFSFWKPFTHHIPLFIINAMICNGEFCLWLPLRLDFSIGWCRLTFWRRKSSHMLDENLIIFFFYLSIFLSRFSCWCRKQFKKMTLSLRQTRLWCPYTCHSMTFQLMRLDSKWAQKKRVTRRRYCDVTFSVENFSFSIHQMTICKYWHGNVISFRSTTFFCSLLMKANPCKSNKKVANENLITRSFPPRANLT